MGAYRWTLPRKRRAIIRFSDGHISGLLDAVLGLFELLLGDGLVWLGKPRLEILPCQRELSLLEVVVVGERADRRVRAGRGGRGGARHGAISFPVALLVL